MTRTAPESIGKLPAPRHVSSAAKAPEQNKFGNARVTTLTVFYNRVSLMSIGKITLAMINVLIFILFFINFNFLLLMVLLIILIF